jgi:hypothetical protein
MAANIAAQSSTVRLVVIERRGEIERAPRRGIIVAGLKAFDAATERPECRSSRRYPSDGKAHDNAAMAAADRRSISGIRDGATGFTTRPK